MDVPVTREWEVWIRGQVEDGVFESAGDLFHEALLLLRARLEDPELKLTLLRREIRIGLEASERGESGPFDAEDLKRRLRDRLTAQPADEETTVT